ncbi:MAG: YggS family pyridoxal phosphate-dependent enzyme [Bacteroidetes bacterium]|nr:MAG: YggS family pyridoxal phosphate-dependent enzyme [Bacteroidota bacterium]
MDIVGNLSKLLGEIPSHVKLIAVSKTKPNEDIMKAYSSGFRFFGENKVQELNRKQPELPNDIEWHFIGHAQTNKVKYIAPFVSLIHSVDSLKLLKEINKQALKYERVIDCLLQFHIATEATKFGYDPLEAARLLESEEYRQMKNIRICGVMGMATYSTDLELVRSEFRKLKGVFNNLKANYFDKEESFKDISMGMSGDYKIAIEEGSTMVRVGSAIFGERDYLK